MPVRHRLLRGNAWVASTPEYRLLLVLRQAISAWAAAPAAPSRDGHATLRDRRRAGTAGRADRRDDGGRRTTPQTRLTRRAEARRGEPAQGCSVRQADSDIVGVCRPGHANPRGRAGLVYPDPLGKD